MKNIVLEQGQSYVGEADILGVSYLCSYVPTKGVDGEITGLIFAGLPITDAKQGTANVISVISVTSLVTITSCVIFLAFYLMRRISKPLQEITCVAQRLERGDLGLKNKEEILQRQLRSYHTLTILHYSTVFACISFKNSKLATHALFHLIQYLINIFVKITFQQFKVMIKYWRFRKKKQFGRMEEQNQ